MKAFTGKKERARGEREGLPGDVTLLMTALGQSCGGQQASAHHLWFQQ